MGLRLMHHLCFRELEQQHVVVQSELNKSMQGGLSIDTSVVLSVSSMRG